MAPTKEVIVAFRTIRWYIVSFLLVVGLCFAFYIFLREINYQRQKDRLIETMTYQKTFRLNDVGVQERYNKYLDFCIRLWNVYGYTYRAPSRSHPLPQSMHPRLERPQVWRLNFELAEMMGFAENGKGYYDVFIKGILESDLDPNAVGPYDERTWLQFKKIAVVQAEGVYETMLPVKWKRKLKFHFNGDMDSISVIDSLKIGYILMWYYKKAYREMPHWYVSMYHWGHGFLGVHFDNGFGVIPKQFTINGVKYDPLSYYISHRTLKDAFELGDIEAGKETVQRWQAKKRKIVKEEKELLSVYKRVKEVREKVKDLELTIAEKDRAIEEAHKQIGDLKNILAITDAEFKKTFGQTLNWKKGDIRTYMRVRSKEIAKQFLEKAVDYRKENKKFLIILGIVISTLLSILVFMIACTVLYFKLRLKYKALLSSFQTVNEERSRMGLPPLK